MLGSEVIKQIQNLIDEYGDLPIEISLNGSDQEEVKEICYGGYGKFSNKPDTFSGAGGMNIAFSTLAPLGPIQF